MISNNLILWTCVLVVFGVSAYQFYKDYRGLKKKKEFKPSLIVHYSNNGRYACSLNVVKPKKEKLTEEWDKVTCKNCRKVKFYQ